jgi:hypothetical protein
MFARIAKKIVAASLVAAMALTAGGVVTQPKQMEAGAKTISMKQGTSKKLKAKKDTTWTCADGVVSLKKKSGKTVEVVACKAGTATVKAGTGQSWKIKVAKASKGTTVYDMANETASDKVPPATIKYETWKYTSFDIFLFNGTYFGYGTYAAPDYRGRKLSVSMSVKNAGNRNLPELGVCFNYTKGGSDGPYPFAYHFFDKGLDSGDVNKVKGNSGHKHCTCKTGTWKPGKTMNIKFTFTIPSDAQNSDHNDQGELYPIMMYIPNLKDSSPYKPGDAITVLSCKVKLAS